MRSRVLPAAALLLLAGPASAVLDQFQEGTEGRHPVHASSTAWQTFTPALSGVLLEVEVSVLAACIGPACAGTPSLAIDIVAVSGGVPTATVLGSVAFAAGSPLGAQVLSADFSAQNVFLTAGQAYAIRLSSPGENVPDVANYRWDLSFTVDAYAGGAMFDDIDPGDGLDDPAPIADTDGWFRTYMDPGSCGDGAVNGVEECDDTNVVDGDGCSALCVDELCGDSLVNDTTETCDDGGTADGDGCSAGCALEDAGLACQLAILKAGRKYASARLAALTTCRSAFAAGKALSISNARECATETAAAKRIARAAGALRNAIAGGNRPKCTDALVVALGTCADTVDGLVSPDATGGCLLTEHEAGVGTILDSELDD
jgi:cysteine-rich repeat protein